MRADIEALLAQLTEMRLAAYWLGLLLLSEREQAVRPEHQMVGHTGFVTVARLVQPSLEPGMASGRA